MGMENSGGLRRSYWGELGKCVLCHKGREKGHGEHELLPYKTALYSQVLDLLNLCYPFLEVSYWL